MLMFDGRIIEYRDLIVTVAVACTRACMCVIA
jgi:hypothetical protein